MVSDRDNEQDENIRRNAEAIRRNEETLRRQTEALEKIRDHYFPKKTLWKSTVKFVLQVVGAFTLYTSIMEAGEWYWNTRKEKSMAEHAATVSRHLLLGENDASGAARFLEKAIELDGESLHYRIALGYVRGLAAIVDLFDLGRPFCPDERERVDAILADAVYLQEVAPEEPMPHILAAQARRLRGENEAALSLVRQAVTLAPENTLVRINACAIYYSVGKAAEARLQLAEAERLDEGSPLVSYWHCLLALDADHDSVAARGFCDDLLRRASNMPIAHFLDGQLAIAAPTPDFITARAAFERALTLNPKLRLAQLGMAETFEREGNLSLARIWLNRLLAGDPRNMKGLVARARLNAKEDDDKAAVNDFTAALALDPFRADLYRERAEAYGNSEENEKAAADLRTAEALESNEKRLAERMREWK